MKFLDNKYTGWYYRIVDAAQSRELSKDIYFESHHIIPKSLGGSNIKLNLVKLTAREHFICHWLLIKMLVSPEKGKMVYAAWSLSNQNNPHQKRNKITARKYEILRKAFIETKTGSKAPASFAVKITAYWTPENRAIHSAKIAKVVTGRVHSQSAIEKMKNKVWTDTAKANRLANCLKSAAARKGKKNPEHSVAIFKNYALKNKEIIEQVWVLFDQANNRRQIAIRLGITWDRVNIAVNKRIDLQNLYDHQGKK